MLVTILINIESGGELELILTTKLWTFSKKKTKKPKQKKENCGGVEEQRNIKITDDISMSEL